MTLIFSNFYKLDEICNIKISGPFNSSWAKTYTSSSSGGGSVTKPDGDGSGLKISSLKLCSGMDVMGDPISNAEFVSMGTQNNLIYLLMSTRYPMIYVGITEGGLRKGIFDTGRLIHHVRKILAIRDSSTSHTEGWLNHAIERYENNVIAHQLRINDEQFNQNLLSDLYIAIAHQGHDAWSPASVEETVLVELDNRWNITSRGIKRMNTARSGRSSIDIVLPGNFANFLA